MENPRKTAVVTGASRGIGKAVALRFAQEGYEVWALARSRADLGALPGPGRVRPLAVDLEQPDQVLAAAKEVLAEGPVAVLVNNAGIVTSASLPKTTLADYERTMAVNARAPFLLCRELAPAMAAAGGGRIINLASTAALKGFKYTSAYCASKHALLGLTRALAVEFAGKGVTVNAVCPGWTDTDMLAASADAISRATGRTPDEARRTLAQLNPMGRLIQPSEVAELCWFLATPAAAAITGAVLSVDAGETA